MPDPSCDSRPEPEPSGPDDSTVDVRRERIDCMLEDSKNGTLVLDVFGIEPPCLKLHLRYSSRTCSLHHHTRQYSPSWFGRAVRGARRKKRGKLDNKFRHKIKWINFFSLPNLCRCCFCLCFRFCFVLLLHPTRKK
jgi:hypothetical protein